MFCKRVTINLESRNDKVHLRPMGDIHLGDLGCDIEKLKRSINKIRRNKNYYTVGMGDYINGILPFANGGIDKRWNPETSDRQQLLLEEQIDTFIELWKPIKNKTWGLLAGNHEWKNINQKRFIQDFCKPLSVPYLGRLAYIWLDFVYRKEIIRNYLILVLHGGYNGMMAGGAVNRLKQIGDSFDADLILMGHNHDTIVRTGVRVGYDSTTNKITERKIVYGNTGTFLTGYKEGIDSYVEINPREARRTGTITVTFEPATGGLYGHD